jgi:hypothetical protein
MIINNAINSPLPTSLAHGGTNANLTASNGGILYSTASAGAILAGTSTASQSLLSGASTTPAWSSATYPSTTTSNQLLYSSSNNVIGGLTGANSASLVLDETGVPVWSLPMTDGQVMIGGTNGRPEPFNLTPGKYVTIENAPGSITINSTIANLTASDSPSLDFDNVFSSNFIAYRLVLVNIFPHNNSTNLWLRFGTGSTPNYVSSGYSYQLFDVSDAGNLAYPGSYTSTPTFNQALTTYAANLGIANILLFGGVCGYIDLFVTAGSTQVASGISRLSYESANNGANYVNTTSTFQLPADNYTSVQLLMGSGLIFSGTAYLYGYST